MFRISSALILLTAGLLLASPFLSDVGLAQEQEPQRILLESVKLPQNNSANFVNRYGITRDDLRNIREHVPGIQDVIPMRNTFVEARYGEHTKDVRICGTEANFSQKLIADKLQGRFLLDKDVKHLNNVAVIGDRVARSLFGKRDPVGHNIRVENDYYLIVGRLEISAVRQVLRAGSLPDHDHSIFIPISTMRARMGDDVIVRDQGSFSAESYELSSVEIIPQNAYQSQNVTESIQTILEHNHPERDYQLRVSE